MSDTPTAGAQELVSMFQTNSVALRVEMLAAWSRVNAAGIAVLEFPQVS
jgi:hypothetical protein